MAASSSHLDPAIRGHAVVIGGSMAGLLAAHALAGHFARVTLVDRDHFPAEVGFRKGVPQSRHIHVLLARGAEIIEQLMPGMKAELVGAGAVTLEWPTQALWYTPRGWSRRFVPGMSVISCSRELLEWHVRQRVAALPNVHILEGQEVVGLLGESDQRRISGVSLRARGTAAGDPSPVEDVPAQLVVDASGRNSRTPEWLEALGYQRPEEMQVNAFLGYATRDYAIPPSFVADWKVIYLQALPPTSTRLGGLFPVEGNRWRVGIEGVGHDYPPTDDAGFLEFARSLRSPVLYETIRDAEPLTPIHGFQRTENQRRFYERLTHLPAGLLATGDALCAFNPIYGQGMTAAAQDALILDQLLRQRAGDLNGLGHAFHQAASKSNAGAWLMATGEDLRYPSTVGGKRDLPTRLIHRYLDRVIRVATEDRGVNTAFTNVIQLVSPPTSLFKPRVLFPALLRGGTQPITQPPLVFDEAAPAANYRPPAASVNAATSESTVKLPS
jgi:2-polyprenyl-6-methoxyphenol hydroxylase-like FAD-dependent oxidoreductase